MLKSLKVNNYILIKELEFSPDKELIVLTGETGAGKSILLGAINLLLGQRADSKTLFDESRKCIIEGIFDIKDYHLHKLFEEFDWDYFDECIIRREIAPNGRSRAFVNDSPANLSEVKDLVENLVDIHSQHESILINNPNYQLDLLDTYARNSQVLHEYQEIYTLHKSKSKELEELVSRKSDFQEDKDYKSFLLKELTEANLEEGEKERLESELSVAQNAESIMENLSRFEQIMDIEDPSLLNMLREAQQQLIRISNHSQQISDLCDRIESVSIELNDINSEVSDLRESIELDPQKLIELKDRVDLINRLETKHKVLDSNELIKIQENLEKELEGDLNLDDRISQLQNEIKELDKERLERAVKLSESRMEISKEFEENMEALLQNLGIEEARINIKISDVDFGIKGNDKIEILFTANKGHDLQSLKSAASGGEISRIMLAMKYLIADKTNLPTIIFDEIDTGISGKVAVKMGEMFKKIAKAHQVISITHLPQIAAMGKGHFLVHKKTQEDKTFTDIRRLSGEERIIEIAQMISGKSDSESAIKSAKELLEPNS